MENFELLRDVTIGQYIPVNSPVHRMDPRFKLVGGLLLALAVSSTRSLLAAGLLVALFLGITLLARLPVGYVLRGLRPILPFVIFLLIFQFFFQGRNVPCATEYFAWRFFVVSPCLFHLLALGVLRVFSFIFLVSLVTMTTTASHMTHSVEALLWPLQRIGFPVHEIALANMIGLRFVPTLAEELERIMKAQASRGAEVGQARWWRPDLMARERTPLIVPLFVNALRRAEDLVLAMESRGYLGGKGRTKFVRFHSGLGDWAALALAAAVWLAAWRVPWPDLPLLFP